MSRREPERWALWSRHDGKAGALYDPPVEVERLPKTAERSGDGKWATVYRDGSLAVEVYILLEDPPSRRRSR